MKRPDLVLLAAVVCTSAACGESDHGHPAVSITSPAAGSTVDLGADADKTVQIGVTVVPFTLKPPGECKGAADCGHLHVNIDGDACNATSMKYNGAYTDAASVVAKFALCPMGMQTGAHTVKVSVHDDGHSDVIHEGKPLAAEVAFTTR